MSKKHGLLMLISLLGTSAVCTANPIENMPILEDCQSPFYVGAGIGPETSYIKQKATIRRNSEFRDGTFDARDKTHHAGKGFFASIYAGYGFYFPAPYSCCDDLYFATEFNADAGSLKFRSYNYELVHENYSDTVYKLGDSYGVSILPGFVFGDSALLYGRFGFLKRKFKILTTDSSLANIHKNLNGLRYGLGMQHPVCDHVSLRVEYSWSSFKSAQFFVVDGQVIKNTFIRPKAGKFELGIVYNF